MRLSELSAPQGMGRRLKRGGPLLLVAALWALLRFLLPMPFNAREAFFPLVIFLGAFALSPLAWQWTDDERALAPMLRGLLQSLVWNAAWILLVLHLLGTLPEGAAPPPRRPPPFAQGPGPMPGLPPPGAPPLRHPLIPGPQLLHLALSLMFTLVLGRSLAEREAAERSEALLQEETQRARALALQSQMEPHALFNALSGLVELVQDDPEATEEALVGLCTYLRRLMDHARRESAPLRQERELLQDYLRIEQIRLGDRLRVVWDWPDWADELRLPPLLLQPLVENAILHGIAPAPEGGELRISLRRGEGVYRLGVDNTGLEPGARRHGLSADRHGLGMGHLRRRLELWAGSRAALVLERKGEWTRASLTLPEDAC